MKFFIAGLMLLGIELHAQDLHKSIANILGYPSGISFDAKKDKLSIAVNESTYQFSSSDEAIQINNRNSPEKININLEAGGVKNILANIENRVTVINFKGNSVSNFTQCLPNGYSGAITCLTITKEYCDKVNKIAGENPYKKIAQCRDLLGDLGELFTVRSPIGKELKMAENLNFVKIKKLGGQTDSSYDKISSYFSKLATAGRKIDAETDESHAAFNYFYDSLNFCQRKQLKVNSPSDKVAAPAVEIKNSTLVK
jgi:hypothetical protein